MRGTNLVLDEKLDTLNGGSGGLGDGSGNTTHYSHHVSSRLSKFMRAANIYRAKPLKHRRATYSGSPQRRAVRQGVSGQDAYARKMDEKIFPSSARAGNPSRRRVRPR